MPLKVRVTEKLPLSRFKLEKPASPAVPVVVAAVKSVSIRPTFKVALPPLIKLPVIQGSVATGLVAVAAVIVAVVPLAWTPLIVALAVAVSDNTPLITVMPLKVPVKLRLSPATVDLTLKLAETLGAKGGVPTAAPKFKVAVLIPPVTVTVPLAATVLIALAAPGLGVTPVTVMPIIGR